MMWLALVFVWFVATALRGRREQFACGALVAGLLTIAALHVINPDALIVRVNVSHALSGKSFDPYYAASLSADAAPALLYALPALSESNRRIIALRLLEDVDSDKSADWRNWNWARAERRRVLNDSVDALSTFAAPSGVEPSGVQLLPAAQSVEITEPLNLPASKPETPAPGHQMEGRSSRTALQRGPKRHQF
jgi:hypothetical protein